MLTSNKPARRTADYTRDARTRFRVFALRGSSNFETPILAYFCTQNLLSTTAHDEYFFFENLAGDLCGARHELSETGLGIKIGRRGPEHRRFVVV